MQLMRPFAHGANPVDVSVLLKPTEELARTILDRIEIARDISTPGFFAVEYQDDALVLLEHAQPRQWLDDDELNQYYSHEIITLDDAPDDPDLLSTEYEMMVVQEQCVYWEFVPKYSYVRYETPRILKDDI